MELQCDVSAIKNEDMLRRMWQQSEDINRKKEIRAHLYKLRESRLRDLYQGDIMSGNFGKDPLNPSHGDSLVDQSFQSLKSKEIRDSISPTHDLKFHSTTLNHPNTTGWDVQTSSEVSPDGRAYRTETVAKTDGIEKINGGIAEFKGHNEQRASASHQGDDKNFVKKASESSNTHLQEKVVVGDENSGRTEMKMSSTTTSSSSQVISSSSTVEHGGEPADNRYLMDNTSRTQQQQQQRLTQEQYEQQLQRQQRQQQQQQMQQQHEQSKHITDQSITKQQQQQQYSEEYNRNLQQSSTSRNVETTQSHEQNKRYVDMDKASPEYQKHVQYLMSQPGEIISNTVEYPKPNVKMITTVKRLPDGTIVKNKRYETEELRPTVDNTHQRTTSSTSQTQKNQSSTQHKTQKQTEENIYNRQQNTRDNTTYSKNSPRRPDVDVVDNIEGRNVYDNRQQVIESHPTERYVDDVSNIETKFSSVKKSSRRFSTETTSESIEEHSDLSPNKPSGRHAPQDFSTHGFPSVKPNKPTQEYASERPHAPQPSNDFSTHGFPSVRPNKPTQEYPTDRPSSMHSTEHQQVTERYVTDSKKPVSDLAPHGFPAQIKPTITKDGEVIVVSSEATKSSKFKTNTERVIESEVIIKEGDYPTSTTHSPEKVVYHTTQSHREDFTTHGFPSVKDSSPARSGSPRATPSRDYPSSPRKSQPTEDYSTHGFPSARDTTKPRSTHENVITVSSEAQKTLKQKANREHIIETEVITEGSDYPSPGVYHPQPITYTISPRPKEDYSTHGFPSVKESSPVRSGSPRQGTPSRDYPSSKPQTHGYPSAKDTTKPKQYSPQPKAHPTTTTTKKSTTATDSTQRLIQKEKEVDAAHRAFAASLRSSSPVDSIDHHQQRHTPRSSISSTKTFRRDGREGSHDSTAPSETSRISSSTVTRQSPNKHVGKTVVTKQTVVKTRNVNGSNETIDLTPQRSTKSPSPSKTITTTTTRTTTTAPKKAPTEVPKTDNQIIKPAENIFPINEPLTITKTHISANDASFPGNEVVEEPCIKRHFYKLGPSDKTSNANTLDALKTTPTQTESLNNATKDRKPTQTKITDTTKTVTELSQSTVDKPPSGGVSDAAPTAGPAEAVQKSTQNATIQTEKQTNRKSKKSTPNARKPTKHVTYEDKQEKHTLHERSPYSPAPSNHKTSTHPKHQSPVRDEHSDNYGEPIHNQPFSSSDIRPKERNQSPSKQTKPKESSPKTISQPEQTDVERRTVVRESAFEKTDNQYTLFDKDEPIYSSRKPVHHTDVQRKPTKEQPRSQPQQPTRPHSKEPKDYDEENEWISETNYTLTDTSEHPKDDEPIGKPTTKASSVRSTTQTTRTEQIKVNEDEIHEEPLGGKPRTQKPREPTGKKPVIQESNKPIGKKPDYVEPVTKTSSIKTTSQKTHQEKTQVTDEESEEEPSGEKPRTQGPQEPIGRRPYKPVQPNDGNYDDRPDLKSTANEYNETTKVNELFKTTHHVKQRKDINEEFITTERDNVHRKPAETPDGAFISKRPEPNPTSPTFKKKGVTERETFEERCRHILGMENDGDTQGVYKKRPVSETQPINKIKTTETPDTENTVIEVKIEDCEDDEPIYLSNIKEHVQPTRKYTKTINTVDQPEKPTTTIDVSDTEEITEVECKRNEKYIPYKPASPDTKRKVVTEVVDDLEKPHKKYPNDRTSVPERERSPADVRPTKRFNEKETSRSPSPPKSKPKTSEESMYTETRRSPSPMKPKPKITEEEIISIETRRSPSPEKTKPRITEKDKTSYVEIRRSPSPEKSRPKISEQTICTETRRSPSPSKPKSKVVEEQKEINKIKTMEKGKISLESRHSTSPVRTSPKSTESRRSPSPTQPKSKRLTTDLQTTSDSESPERDSEVETEQEIYISEKGIKHIKETVIEHQKRGPSPTAKRTSPEKSVRKPSEPNVTPTRASPTKSPIRKQPDATSSTTQKTGTTTTKKITSHDIYEQPKKPSGKNTIINKSPKSLAKIDTVNVDVSEKRTTSNTVVRAIDKSEKHTIVNKEEVRPRSQPQASPVLKTTLSKTVRKDAETLERVIDHSKPVKQPRKPSCESPTPTIKDRLRSSTRKPKPKSGTDTNSSPETSPTRGTERRRSSNISVHTEIIIDHSGPKSPKPEEKFPKTQKPQTKQPTTKETVDHPVAEKPYRRFPVTERKESAPVHSVTRKDKDAKMTRSTSEKIMKVVGKPTSTKPEMSSLSPISSPKADRRPNKCLTTKTINLTTTDRIINSDEMENVIIDIQHAKSSREPSPDKIVPTPVPIDLDTGKPRYPDVVQEPEDEPRKKPVIKNIPIFEEETNDYVSCQISEINIDKSMKSLDINEEDILDNPTIEAPKSLDYTSIDKPDDDCLLSVHEKVSKFTHTAEEIKKPKASSPFNRDIDRTPSVPENDDCLLTVDEKVTKFIKTAEGITKPVITPSREIDRPNFEEIDEDLRKDDCTLTVSQKVNKFINTAEKLAPTVPQKSPVLVARIERTISKQSEPEYPEDVSDDEPLTPFSKDHTTELEKKRQKDILSRPSIFETNKNTDYYSEHNTKEVTEKRKIHSTNIDIDTTEDDDFTPMTKQHTTNIELKRQKDILSRPSVFEPKSSENKPQVPTQRKPQSPSSTKKFIDTERRGRFEREEEITSNKAQPSYPSGRKPESPNLSNKFIDSERTNVYSTEHQHQAEITSYKKTPPKSSEIRLSSPPSRSKSPSPERKPLSPERKSQSPNKRLQSPERKPHSPERKSQSPEKKPQSPERKSQYPSEVRPKSPSERKPQSPERKPQSPGPKAPQYSAERKPKSSPAKTFFDSGNVEWVESEETEIITDKRKSQYPKPTNEDKPRNSEPKPSKAVPSYGVRPDQSKSYPKTLTSKVSTTRSRFESPTHQKTPARRTPAHEPNRHVPAATGNKKKLSTDEKSPSDIDIKESDYPTTESETEITTSTVHRKNIEKVSTQKVETTGKITLSGKSKKPEDISPSPIRNGSPSTKTTITKVTQRTYKHTSPSEASDTEIIETILERPTSVKTSPVTVGRTKVLTDTVAARRNLFEKNIPSKPHRPLTPVQSGRRPSYMDHTKSSLEHTRRDSLEVNKQNYSRKSSVEDDAHYDRRPNTAVTFDVPHRPSRGNSIPEDIDVESIFDLEVLERLLETVTSYEIRRRIRAQIRLVKKNMLNTTENSVDKKKFETKASTIISSAHKSSTYSSKVHHETTDSYRDDMHMKKPRDRSHSPKHPTKTVLEREDVTVVSERKPHDKKYTSKLQQEETVTITDRKYSKSERDRSESPKRCSKTPHDYENADEYKYTKVLHEGTYSPETKTFSNTLKEVRRTSGPHTTTQKQYLHTEEVDFTEKITKSPGSVRKTYSPERGYSPERDSSPSARHRSQSPQIKHEIPSGRDKSPDAKTKKPGRTTSPQSKITKQREQLHSASKVTTIKNTHSSDQKTSKPKTDVKTPIWADRKNVLKGPSGITRKTPTSPATRNTTVKTSTTKSVQSSRQSKSTEEDSITSSYGIGPTDENGLPLFGIKALKKKKETLPCETTDEVTGYVIEEKYYSDNKTKPTVERKEYIYSTNADELEQIKKQVESRKSSHGDDEAVVMRKFKKIDKEFIHEEPKAIMPECEEFSSTKYVRRGSVKEMSEKFIRKESSQSITEKSSSYPKAGLILLTKGGTTADAGDCYESTSEKYVKTSSNTAGYRPAHDDAEEKYETGTKRTTRMITESDSECDEKNVQKGMSEKISTVSKRSFLNSSGESKVVTGIDDVLERMRNADYVVEEGDTAEDQEARSLLNKFLGASVIMKGCESTLPTQQTITTTTTTSYGDDSDGDNLTNQGVKTTRITKTIKSGSSSTPVTRTTCDIEEIWDEEILKELLEQATTYEERRKIRARLRELMAEREDKKDLKSGEKSAPDVEEDESSSSEYEEIIEEVTDYSDAEAELEDEPQTLAPSEEDKAKAKTVTKESDSKQEAKEVKKEDVKENSSNKSIKVSQVHSDENDTVTKETATKAATTAKATATDTNTTTDKGESLMPLLQDLLHKNLPQAKVAASQSSNLPNKHAKQQAAKTTNTSTTNKASTAGNIAAHCSSETSSLCTESEKYTNSTHTHSHTKTNNNNNNNTHQQPNKTKTNSKESQKPPQKTMTKDGVTTAVPPKRVGGSDSSASQMDRLSVPQKEDSGTESGEDLRLIAAGLRDKLQLQSDTNLIQEVTTALSRLESSLKEGKDISVDGSKREALLALVARLQTGLTSPEKLAEVAATAEEMDGSGVNYDETSSPEADAHRPNRQRFARRRNRNSRHTVGVSREELADARRYMEDMLLMENISNSTTPDASTNPVTPPQWFPIEKNASSGAILTQAQSVLYRPNQFVPSNIKQATEGLDSEQHIAQSKEPTRTKRPLSGNYSVSFEQSQQQQQQEYASSNGDAMYPSQVEAERNTQNASPDSLTKSNRFSSKKQMMKRANTIDIPKSKKYNPDFDSDSETEDRGPIFGLKRTVQVSVKHRARNVIPPFEPKTENDHKFLAFINKQSAKPGLGWNNSRSVSNWTNKFGNLKHTFEVGAAASTTTGKPPQAPGHVSHGNAAKNYWNKQFSQYPPDYGQSHNQSATQRNQYEIAERQHRLERERLEREHIERDRLERQRQERDRLERDRLEREYYERERMERERLAAAQHAAMPSMSVPKPAPVNKFIHAPQSVFRPIDNNDLCTHNIFKPIPQLPTKVNTWQPPSTLHKTLSAPAQIAPQSPQFLLPKQTMTTSHVTSPASSTSSPIGLPWVSKPAVNNSDFKKKANAFEERSQNDNRTSSYLQRHNSLRSPRGAQPQMEEYKKRPSLPNTTDPYLATHSQYVPQQTQQIYTSAVSNYPPPPTNISFTYADYNRKGYKSQPCLPLAVESEYVRNREDSLTDPHSVPLVLTSSNPSYNTQPDSLQPYTNAPPKQFDYISPMDSTPTSPSIMTMVQTDYTDDDLDSEMLEYRVESKVMGKPQSQTAVTVGNRTAYVSDDEVFGKNSRAAQNLLHTMKNIGGSAGGVNPKRDTVKQRSTPTSPSVCLSPDGRPYQAPIVEPLFPQLTNFEPNRSPLYTNQGPTQPPPSKYSKKRTYTPPIPQHSDRSLQISKFDMPHRQQLPYTKSNTAPYLSETQTPYVVTYPVEDHHENVYPKQHPTSLPLQRNRNTSENSTTSSSISMSMSQNLPSPGTSWTTNPMHMDDYPSPQQQRATKRAEQIPNSNASQQHEYQPNHSRQYITQPHKPEVAPKPQMPPSSVRTQQYVPPPQTYQQPSSSQKTYQQAPPIQSPQQQLASAPKLPEAPPVSHYQPPPQKVAATERPKLAKKGQPISTATHSQSFDSHYQTQKSTFTRQSAVDTGITPLQIQNRVLSQQSLVSKKQQQFQQQEQQLAESRRKSMGNVLDSQQQQRNQSYQSEMENVIKQEYKSSAPADTPDIVKSSLPKEDMPILKKFGPPQRHHYVPNSYQTPSTNTQSKKFESSTKVIRTAQHEIVQHSTLTTKPSIVETPATPQPAEDLIPRNIVFNNVNAFTSMSRRRDDDDRQQEHPQPRMNRLSKSDSWNQLMQLQNQSNAQRPPTSPKFNTSGELRRTKSGHSLNIRMYEAGIDKAEVGEKQRTVAAYFSGKKSPNQLVSEAESRTAASSKKSAINRTKTSEKISTSQQQQSATTTEKTETKEEDGAVVTTTTKVTTRTVTGTGTAPKPVSPFAKFRQLDKQNSLQSQKSPSTPTTPGGTAASPSGSARIFQFTDPALNARAATVKDQLLQWCQSKTQEYENVQITNFSTSWSDGLAFCALMHHFLPDAFDYSKLTPKSRRHNFELAFTVADEKAGIAPLLDVEDMVEMKRPDWKCVFVYVQSIYRRFRNCQ